ncbi:3-hydroxyisobutyrate dehydrogenase [Duganella sp. CF458]|uniref:NAD(P)-dependent oxidoreductase n=1 Tax=Duganella sp. CF458 TaxID=1884368 RepID=UPI0008ED7CC5|nr:NAD(P)-binding domain-containing protein [Duganella sp. CF458]SFF99036.1 3-hydroxyisobutyrate dehydrogenase [Duganella sp. CF458]
MKSIAVIGLGQMGSTLAQLLLDAGFEVHVWNRSPGKATALVEASARLAASPADAAARAQFVVMCVHDHAAAMEILSQQGVWHALEGKALLQFTTFSPQEAAAASEVARAHGVAYLSGAIQVAPEQMGKPDTTILLSGPRNAVDGANAVLATFGGNVAWLGESASAAPTMDLATLSFVYGATAGFLQGAALAQREGLDLKRYGEIVHAMSPSFGEFLQHEAKVIDSGDFAISQSPLSISVDATRRIDGAMREAGLDDALPAVIAQLLERAVAKGLAGEELAALVKVIDATS